MYNSNYTDAAIERHLNRFDVPLLTEVVHNLLLTQQEWNNAPKNYSTVGEYLQMHSQHQQAVVNAVADIFVSSDLGDEDPFEAAKEAVCNACEFIRNFIDPLSINFNRQNVQVNPFRLRMSDILRDKNRT